MLHLQQILQHCKTTSFWTKKCQRSKIPFSSIEAALSFSLSLSIFFSLKRQMEMKNHEKLPQVLILHQLSTSSPSLSLSSLSSDCRLRFPHNIDRRPNRLVGYVFREHTIGIGDGDFLVTALEKVNMVDSSIGGDDELEGGEEVEDVVGDETGVKTEDDLDRVAVGSEEEVGVDEGLRLVGVLHDFPFVV